MTRFQPPPRSWPQKIAAAIRGMWLGIRGQSSFYVHLAFTVAVPVIAGLLHVSQTEWCLLVVCIAAVLSAEMFNSALERMARAVDENENPYLAEGLDIASGAVLVIACGAAGVGAMILGPPLFAKLAG